MYIKVFIGFLFTLVLISCGGTESFQDRIERNDMEIQDYLAANNIDAVMDPSGVYINVINEGGSEKPSLSSQITITYKGYDLDGNVFDQSTNPISFPLSGLIEGWQIGIPYFGKGGNGQLFIPANWAYGNNSPSEGNVIIFDIELIDF